MSLIANIDTTNTYTIGNQVYGKIFIKLTDANTGQLTNGNNVAVSYLRNLNGEVANYTITIAGQSAAIYAGLLSDPDTGYFTSFSITGTGAVTAPDLPANECDLLISRVKVDKAESAPGAKDAQITVIASSSYGSIEYFIDADAPQSSPVFTGLSGGLITVNAHDSNSCQAEFTVKIPILTNLLSADPSLTLSDGNISRWNAAFNPIVFTYQRKDFNVSAVTEDTEKQYAILKVDAPLINQQTSVPVLKAGDKVYVNAGMYKGIYEVEKTTPDNTLIIRTGFAGNAAGYININQLRPYYKMITRINYTDKLTGLQNTIKSTNRPDGTGLIKADLSNFLQSLLRAKDESTYTQSNFRDDNLSASYQIAYAEEWDENGVTKTSDFVNINHTYYILYAAKQLGERYGGNLVAFVPFSNLAGGLEKARWVTDFAEPAYSNGYPFDIGFIYSEDLLGRELYCEFTLLDINRTPMSGGLQTVSLLNEDGSWLLNQDGNKFIIARQSTGTIPIPAQLGLNRLLIDTSFTEDVYFIDIALKYADGNTVHTVTQTQTIRVDDAIDDQWVYLRWIGLSGSWNYYRFIYNQEISLDVQNAVIIKNYVNDWEHQDSIEEVISKTAGQKIKVVAEDLSVADIKGLQSIKYSPKVQMLVNKNPVKWQTIIINTATYSEYETRNGYAPFSLTFNLPAINIQTQ